jgi:hypothetical protein
MCAHLPCILSHALCSVEARVPALDHLLAHATLVRLLWVCRIQHRAHACASVGATTNPSRRAWCRRARGNLQVHLAPSQRHAKQMAARQRVSRCGIPMTRPSRTRCRLRLTQQQRTDMRRRALQARKSSVRIARSGSTALFHVHAAATNIQRTIRMWLNCNVRQGCGLHGRAPLGCHACHSGSWPSCRHHCVRSRYL